jgi:hypothetical protein
MTSSFLFLSFEGSQVSGSLADDAAIRLLDLDFDGFILSKIGKFGIVVKTFLRRR